MNDSVTIVILNRNSARYLFETLESIFIQDYHNIQLVICDDFSNDFPSEAVINKCTKCRKDNIRQIILYETKHYLGKYKTLLSAMDKYCSSEWVMIMDSGDTFNSAQSLRTIMRETISDKEIYRYQNNYKKKYFTTYFYPLGYALYKKNILNNVLIENYDELQLYKFIIPISFYFEQYNIDDTNVKGIVHIDENDRKKINLYEFENWIAELNERKDFLEKHATEQEIRKMKDLITSENESFNKRKRYLSIKTKIKNNKKVKFIKRKIILFGSKTNIFIVLMYFIFSILLRLGMLFSVDLEFLINFELILSFFSLIIFCIIYKKKRNIS